MLRSRSRPGSAAAVLAVAAATLLATNTGAQADGISTIMAKNTSTCVLGDTTSPADCAATFAGQDDTAAGITTPVFDPPGGNVSTQNIHGLLYPGNTTKVYVNVMRGFCTPPDGTSSASVPRCNSNVTTQYTENDTLTVDKRSPTWRSAASTAPPSTGTGRAAGRRTPTPWR